MNDYNGKVVVITGAASGIGKELARRFAAAGAKLALADIDSQNLGITAKELKDRGTEVISSVFDVGDYDAMAAFARATFERYDVVDLFFNNAGVCAVGTIWEQALEDWRWSLNVNVMGLVHGIKAFIPDMIKTDRECRIINTGSIAGLLTPDNSAAYVASKHAAVSLTEVLEVQLQGAGAKVKAYVICPAFVKTDLHHCGLHRPQDVADTSDPFYQSEGYQRELERMDQLVLSGLPVETAVDRIIDGLEQDKFYIMTHPEYAPFVVARANGIAAGVRPVKR